MKTVSGDLCRAVSVRTRVAFVLAVAERVLPALVGHAEAFHAARKALADGWRWEEGKRIKALQLYDDDVEALAVQGSLIRGPETSAAMCAATSAFYYVLWQAFKHDLTSGFVREGEVPNDIADVTEEVIDEVCDFAMRTSLCDHRWIASLAERLSADFGIANPDDLEPVVPREYFE
jgi:hypothetical protein